MVLHTLDSFYDIKDKIIPQSCKTTNAERKRSDARYNNKSKNRRVVHNNSKSILGPMEF